MYRLQNVGHNRVNPLKTRQDSNAGNSRLLGGGLTVVLPLRPH